MIKMVRSSIRQSKENYLSIDDMKKDISGQDYNTLSTTSQYTSSTFDMMNTLMVTQVYNVNYMTQFSDAYDTATTTRHDSKEVDKSAAH